MRHDEKNERLGRIARNNAMFRAANEQISSSAKRRGPGPVPILCECADGGCTAIFLLDPEAYADVRRDSRRFLCVAGHERAEEDAAVVVARNDGYVIVEKVGDAGKIVEVWEPPIA